MATMVGMQNRNSWGKLPVTISQLQILQNRLDEARLSEMYCSIRILVDVNPKKILNGALGAYLVVVTQGCNNIVNNPLLRGEEKTVINI